MTVSEPDIAADVLDALDKRAQIAPIPGLSLQGAYGVTERVRQLRVARGARVVGRKIGFTNRTIWDEYDVHAPIWGYVYDETLHTLDDGARAGDYVEPRIEPEIVFGLGAAISAEMSVEKIAARIEWVAHGFEIVQSLFPGWRFKPADTVAGFGLHGGLFVGPRRALRAGEARALESFEIDLARNGELKDHGRAANVLDGPLHALRHLAQTLASDARHPPLAAGETVTTGTLTRAFPIAPGEVWTTRLSGIDLPGARLAVS